MKLCVRLNVLVYFRFLGTNGFHVKAENERFTAAGPRCRPNFKNRELTNRQLWLDNAVGFRDMSTAHAFKGTYLRRVKVYDVSDSNSPAS